MVLDAVAQKIRRSGPNPVTSRQQNTSWPWPNAGNVTGVAVNDATALSVTGFYRGVALIARTLGGLPLQVYQEDIAADGTEGESYKIKTRDTGYIWRRPNQEQTKQVFWERIFADEVRGNAYIWVDKEPGAPDPLGIWRIERGRVKPGRTSDGQKVYLVDGQYAMIDYKQGGEIVHLQNWGDSLTGYDPMAVAPQAIALGISAEEYVAHWFSQGNTPEGLLTTDQILTQAQSDEVADRWEERHAGTRKAHKIAVLSGGAKFQATSTDPEKAQLETLRRFQLAEIARLLGLPMHLLSDPDHASQGGGLGVEEQNRSLIQFNFQAHINTVEQGVSDDLLVRELTNRCAKFNLEGLLRGTTLQRFQAYRLADWMTKNEKRAKEDLPAIEGGDVLTAQMQDVPIGQLGDPTSGQQQNGGGR